MRLETMAKIIQAEAAKGKDVEQLALGYLEEVSKSNVDKLKEAMLKKGYWQCGCGLLHPEAYVCTILEKK